MILDDIVRYKLKKIEEEKSSVNIKEIMKNINDYKDRDFKKALSRDGIGIIAEVKKASPSKGIIKKDFNYIDIAKEYNKNNVSAISVLTEDHFFKGSKKYIRDIKEVTDIPLLRKDFIIDEYQVYQSKYIGANAILLIVAILDKEKINHFKSIANDLGMDCLVEVHNKEELDIAIDCDADIIGINNRDLYTFKTSIDTTKELIEYIPNDKIVISESGINTRDDVLFLDSLGANGLLIGESLMKSSSISQKISELRGE